MNGLPSSTSSQQQQQQQQQPTSSSTLIKTDMMEGIEHGYSNNSNEEDLTEVKSIQIELHDGETLEEPNTTATTMQEEQLKPFLRPGHEQAFSWFYNPEFEGSFPSRILPFLYLGNLAHASNPRLLKSLGIQYVLSVGEEAHGLAGAEYASSSSSSAAGEGKGEEGAMEVEFQPKRFMVKLVDDMYDNGVDSLWRHLESCVDFVGKDPLSVFLLLSFPWTITHLPLL
jgi:hypothetical protein